MMCTLIRKHTLECHGAPLIAVKTSIEKGGIKQQKDELVFDNFFLWLIELRV